MANRIGRIPGRCSTGLSHSNKEIWNKFSQYHAPTFSRYIPTVLRIECSWIYIEVRQISGNNKNDNHVEPCLCKLFKIKNTYFSKNKYFQYVIYGFF